MQTSSADLSKLISGAYSRDQNKATLIAFKATLRVGRKFGFPTICTIENKTDREQIHWAASLLVVAAGTWPQADLPELLEPTPGSPLFNDAKELLETALLNLAASQTL